MQSLSYEVFSYFKTTITSSSPAHPEFIFLQEPGQVKMGHLKLGKTKFLMLKLVQQARGDVVPRLLKVQKSSFNSGIACRRFKSHVMQLEALLRGVAPMLTAIGLVPSFLATDFDYGLLVYSTSKECCVV
ncbi:uncharacterized protein LOC133710273 isoform X3 [Rosa rugosa]|uniref:uncharacterized protein LOC133710273 isoform X3 n=1 Tax=Rosa rugosa TaxID=74645 RepID=UPI002B405FC0|nr:uncharacterized protein LOC133710273 isoform X3 [Rosa rugosa]